MSSVSRSLQHDENFRNSTEHQFVWISSRAGYRGLRVKAGRKVGSADRRNRVTLGQGFHCATGQRSLVILAGGVWSMFMSRVFRLLLFFVSSVV